MLKIFKDSLLQISQSSLVLQFDKESLKKLYLKIYKVTWNIIDWAVSGKVKC